MLSPRTFRAAVRRGCTRLLLRAAVAILATTALSMTAFLSTAAAQPGMAPGVLPSGVSMPDLVTPVPGSRAMSDSTEMLIAFVEPEAADQEVGTTVLRPETPDSARSFEPVPPVWVDQPTMKGVRAYEALFNATTLEPGTARGGGEVRAPEVTADACPAVETHDLDAPAAYDREATLLPPGQVAYFYSRPDSLVRCAVYRWDEATQMTGREFIELMRDGGIDPETVLATYDVMFEEVVRSVRRRLGEPMHLDPAPASTGASGVSHRRTARWQTDGVVIDLRLAISRIGGHLTVVQYWDDAARDV